MGNEKSENDDRFGETYRTDYSGGPNRTVKTLMAVVLGLFVATLVYWTGHFEVFKTHVHSVIEVESQEVFVTAEVMPSLIGDLSSIQENIHYPEIARIAGIQGKVIIQFVVDEKGRVVDPTVVRGIGAGCDEEALKAVRTARFVAGRQEGKPVRVRMSLPVVFRL